MLTALGVVNWLKDEEAFLARLSQLAEGKFFIFTYDLWAAQRELSSLDGCMASFRGTFEILRRLSYSGGACSLPGH